MSLRAWEAGLICTDYLDNFAAWLVCGLAPMSNPIYNHRLTLVHFRSFEFSI